MSKMIAFDQEARDAMRRGVSKLSRAVKVTLGPKGRNVILQKSFGSPTVTKDGVTVAKEIDLEDPYENIGAQMVREVASKTSDVAGDGTTTATLLAEAIFNEGLKAVVAGVNPVQLKQGIEKAIDDVSDKRFRSAERWHHSNPQTQGGSSMNFRPLHDRVVVRRVDEDETTSGGIIIPDTAKEKPMQGEILAVGPGARNDKGEVVPLDVKTGDRVLFGKWSGNEVTIDGEELAIMKESDIMGVLEIARAKKGKKAA